MLRVTTLCVLHKHQSLLQAQCFPALLWGSMSPLLMSASVKVEPQIMAQEVAAKNGRKVAKIAAKEIVTGVFKQRAHVHKR